jgi:ABC-type dipeptide/oligopeptide/nickel transport system permease component
MLERKEPELAMYLAKRLAGACVVLWAIITITFGLMHAIPGGPFTQEKNHRAIHSRIYIAPYLSLLRSPISFKKSYTEILTSSILAIVRSCITTAPITISKLKKLRG